MCMLLRSQGFTAESFIFTAGYNTKILKERLALVLNQFEHISVL